MPSPFFNSELVSLAHSAFLNNLGGCGTRTFGGGKKRLPAGPDAGWHPNPKWNLCEPVKIDGLSEAREGQGLALS